MAKGKAAHVFPNRGKKKGPTPKKKAPYEDAASLTAHTLPAESTGVLATNSTVNDVAAIDTSHSNPLSHVESAHSTEQAVDNISNVQPLSRETEISNGASSTSGSPSSTKSSSARSGDGNQQLQTESNDAKQTTPPSSSGSAEEHLTRISMKGMEFRQELSALPITPEDEKTVFDNHVPEKLPGKQAAFSLSTEKCRETAVDSGVNLGDAHEPMPSCSPELGDNSVCSTTESSSTIVTPHPILAQTEVNSNDTNDLSCDALIHDQASLEPGTPREIMLKSEELSMGTIREIELVLKDTGTSKSREVQSSADSAPVTPKELPSFKQGTASSSSRRHAISREVPVHRTTASRSASSASSTILANRRYGSAKGKNALVERPSISRTASTEPSVMSTSQTVITTAPKVPPITRPRSIASTSSTPNRGSSTPTPRGHSDHKPAASDNGVTSPGTSLSTLGGSSMMTDSLFSKKPFPKMNGRSLAETRNEKIPKQDLSSSMRKTTTSFNRGDKDANTAPRARQVDRAASQLRDRSLHHGCATMRGSVKRLVGASTAFEERLGGTTTNIPGSAIENLNLLEHTPALTQPTLAMATAKADASTVDTEKPVSKIADGILSQLSRALMKEAESGKMSSQFLTETPSASPAKSVATERTALAQPAIAVPKAHENHRHFGPFSEVLKRVLRDPEEDDVLFEREPLAPINHDLADEEHDIEVEMNHTRTTPLSALAFVRKMQKTFLGSTSFDNYIDKLPATKSALFDKREVAHAFIECVTAEAEVRMKGAFIFYSEGNRGLHRWKEPDIQRWQKLGSVTLADFLEQVGDDDVPDTCLWEVWKDLSVLEPKKREEEKVDGM